MNCCRPTSMKQAAASISTTVRSSPLVLRYRARRNLGQSAVTVLLCCLVASGCSHDNPDAPPDSSSRTATTTVVPTTPSSTASPSPTATPISAQPTKPTLPAANRQDTAAGARATAVYWLRTLGYAFDSGDTKPMRAISFPNCQACANYGDAIDDVIRMGGKTTLHEFSRRL